MENIVKVDNFGRVLIPKRMRDDLGLRPGSSVILEERAKEIALRSSDEAPKLKTKGKVLVASVKPVGDIVEAVETQRRRRISQFTFS